MKISQKDIRDLAAFVTGLMILVHETTHDPPLDRQWLVFAAVTLILYGLGKFNGRHGPPWWPGGGGRE